MTTIHGLVRKWERPRASLGPLTRAGALALAALGLGACSFEAMGEESPGTAQEAVTTRGKTISMQPIAACTSGLVSEAVKIEATCLALDGSNCRYVFAQRPWSWTTRHYSLVPQRANGTFTFDEERELTYVDRVSCWGARTDSPSSSVMFRAGMSPNKRLAAIETIFEHIRDVAVSGTVELGLQGQDVPTGAFELALQTLNSKGDWVDRAVARNGRYYYNEPSNSWVGRAEQTVTVKATLPPNEPVLLRLRSGAASVKGSDIRGYIRDASLTGEECVPDNQGGCL